MLDQGPCTDNCHFAVVKALGKTPLYEFGVDIYVLSKPYSCRYLLERLRVITTRLSILKYLIYIFVLFAVPFDQFANSSAHFKSVRALVGQKQNQDSFQVELQTSSHVVVLKQLQQKQNASLVEVTRQEGKETRQQPGHVPLHTLYIPRVVLYAS